MRSHQAEQHQATKQCRRSSDTTCIAQSTRQVGYDGSVADADRKGWRISDPESRSFRIERAPIGQHPDQRYEKDGRNDRKSDEQGAQPEDTVFLHLSGKPRHRERQSTERSDDPRLSKTLHSESVLFSSAQRPLAQLQEPAPLSVAGTAGPDVRLQIITRSGPAYAELPVGKYGLLSVSYRPFEEISGDASG